MVHQFLNYIQANWLQDAIDLYTAVNVIAVGARVIGWSKFADELSKIENAVQAMVDTLLKRNQNQPPATPKTGV